MRFSFSYYTALTISDSNIEVIDIDDAGDVDYSYFGSSPNPAPGDYSPGDIANDYVDLFVHSNKCSREYKKDRKIKIFYKALTVEMKILLGDSPSRRVDRIYMSYIQDLKSRSRWKLDQIALPVYYLGKHVNELLEARAKRGCPRTSASFYFMARSCCQRTAHNNGICIHWK